MNKKELGALIIDGTDDFYRVAKSILKEDADCVRRNMPKPGLYEFC